MAKPQKSHATSAETRPPPPPPARRLGPCPTCGCTVLADAWGSEPLHPVGPCTSPVTDDPHDCAVALLQYAARWQFIVRLHRGVPVVYTCAASV
jgi:hypothetical protein